jgi:hypothetical protein
MFLVCRSRESAVDMNPWVRLVSLLSLGVLGAHGCGPDFEQEVKPPPVIVRSITPADSVQLGSYDPFDLSITFNRSVSIGEIRVESFPEPRQAGVFRTTGSGRNATWFDFAPNPELPAHRFLLDGHRMARPMEITLYTPGVIPRALFSGKIISDDLARVNPIGTVVFALPFDSPFNPLEPETFVDVKPVQFDIVEGTDLQGNGAYAMPHLVPDTSYIVVAIFDLNEDAIYDPTVDWWGFHGDELANDPEVVMAHVPHPDRGDPDRPQPETDVDIKLRAPQ